MSEENQKNTNNGQYNGEQLYWYLAQDGRYYDQYGRPWMGDQQQYQNDGSDSYQQYNQEYNQCNSEGYGSQEQNQEQIDENADENTGYGYDSSNAEWKRNSNELENNTYGQEYVQNNVQENTQYVQNYEQNNQQLNQSNELQEYPYDSQQNLQQEFQQDYPKNYQQEYGQGYNHQGYNYQGYDQEPCQQYNQEYTQGYEKTNDGTQTYEKETDSLEQTYSYQNDYQTGNQNENSYGNTYPEQGGWPQTQDGYNQGYNYSDNNGENNGENYRENCYQNVQEYQKESDTLEQTYTYEQPFYQEGYQDEYQMNQSYGEQYIGNSEEVAQNTEEFASGQAVSGQEMPLQDEQTDEQDTQTYRENRLMSEAGPSYQEYKKAQEQLNSSKVDYTKNKKKSNKIISKIGLIVLAGVLAGGGFGIYNNFFRDKSEVRVCESTTSYNKGIGFTFYIGADGQTITAIEKNDKVSLDFIKKNVTEENAKQILEEYKKNVKSTYEENVEKYKKLDFFSSDIKVKSDSISTKYRFDVSSKKFKYKKYEAMMNDFGLNYYYNEDLGKFVYNEEQFLSASTPLGGIDNVKCDKVDIKVVRQEAKDNK